MGDSLPGAVALGRHDRKRHGYWLEDSMQGEDGMQEVLGW